MSVIRALRLQNFRNYEALALGDLPPGLLALHGPNGAGKTNILEAVSLLAPGRGLRGVGIDEMQRHGSDRAAAPWAIATEIDGRHGTAKIGTGSDPAGAKRLVRINNAAAKGQTALVEYVAALWLTPQMDRLFADAAGPRRRFFDRLVYTFDPGHAARTSRYENAMAQRARLLREGGGDPAWLDGLETAMAENGVAIAAARVDFLRRLDKAAASEEVRTFPRASLAIDGPVEQALSRTPAVELEQAFRAELRQARGIDGARGGASFGPHRSDFAAHYVVKNVPAAQCSTGEQKALLIGIILAHARLVAAARGAPPILLLDEVAAHLDEGRRRGLFEILRELGGQVWMTGTDASLFKGASAGLLHVQQGHVTS